MPDHPRQRDRHPEARVIAERAEVRGEPRLLARHAKIGDQRKSQPGADRAAVHCRDDGLAGLHQTLRLVVKMPRPRCRLARRFVVDALLQVRARAEVLACCRKDDTAAVGFLVERLQHRGETPDQIDVEKIVGGAFQLDRGDMSVHADADILIAQWLFHLLMLLSVANS